MVATFGDPEIVAPRVAVLAPNDWVTASDAPCSPAARGAYAAVVHGTPAAESIATSNAGATTPERDRDVSISLGSATLLLSDHRRAPSLQRLILTPLRSAVRTHGDLAPTEVRASTFGGAGPVASREQ